jgi:hypothetical protein
VEDTELDGDIEEAIKCAAAFWRTPAFSLPDAA